MGSIHPWPTKKTAARQSRAGVLCAGMLVVLVGTLTPAAMPARAEKPALPPVVQRGLAHAVGEGDPDAIGQLVGGNAMFGAEIVAIAVAKRPDLAARIAAAAAGYVPQVAPQLAAAAAVANPEAAADIAAAVAVVVPPARAPIMDAVVGALPPDERQRAAIKIHAAVESVEIPSLDDPQ